MANQSVQAQPFDNATANQLVEWLSVAVTDGVMDSYRKGNYSVCLS